MSKLMRLSFDFAMTKTKSGETYIEGMANAATVDRGNERIDHSKWQLDNYKKNPVVLFDHGKDPAFGTMPIGKTLVVEPQQGGLYSRMQLSQSKTEKLTAIRDLVEEGILKTFSVGFNPIEMSKDADGVTIIDGAELLEISVVPIPMNQDSTFTVMAKRFASTNPLARRWLDEQVTTRGLLAKGQAMAAVINQRVFDLGLKQIDVTHDVAIRSGQPAAKIAEIMTGRRRDMSLAVVSAFSKVLGLDKEFLINTDKADLDLFERARTEQSSIVDGGKGMPKKKTTPPKSIKAAPSSMIPAPDASTTTTPPPANDNVPPVADATEKPQMLVYALEIPKTIAATDVDAAALADQHGFESDSVTDNGDTWLVAQRQTDDLNLDAGVEIQTGEDGTCALAAPLAAGKSTDAAKAAPPAADQDPDQAEDDAEDAALKKLLTAAIEELKANPGSDKVPAMLQQAIDQLNKPEADEGTPPPAGKSLKDIGATDDNPYHELSKQQLILMGALINEVQLMSAKLNGMAEMSVNLSKMVGNATTTETPPADDNQDAAAKKADIMNRFRRVDHTLKNIGV